MADAWPVDYVILYSATAAGARGFYPERPVVRHFEHMANGVQPHTGWGSVLYLPRSAAYRAFDFVFVNNKVDSQPHEWKIVFGAVSTSKRTLLEKTAAAAGAIRRERPEVSTDSRMCNWLFFVSVVIDEH